MFKKSIIVVLLGLFVTIFMMDAVHPVRADDSQPQATPSAEDKKDGDKKTPHTDGFCATDAKGQHPHALALANTYGVSYQEIMGWFCKGYGFGEISKVYATVRNSANTDNAKMKLTPQVIFAMREAGMGWGQIRNTTGVDWKTSKAGKGNTGNGNGHQPKGKAWGFYKNKGSHGNGQNANGKNPNGDKSNKGDMGDDNEDSGD